MLIVSCCGYEPLFREFGAPRSFGHSSSPSGIDSAATALPGVFSSGREDICFAPNEFLLGDRSTRDPVILYLSLVVVFFSVMSFYRAALNEREPHLPYLHFQVPTRNRILGDSPDARGY